MFDTLMKKLGYIKESSLTEEYLAGHFAREIGDPTDYEITRLDEKSFFEDLSKIDKARDFLKATMAKDMQRYFAAPDEKSRNVIQGAFARTVYLAGKLKEVQAPNKITKVEKASNRYA
jgi:hypothetical protein